MTDFSKDHFESYICQYFKEQELKKVLLAYRFSKNALPIKRPRQIKAVMALIEDLINCKLISNDDNIYIYTISLLLNYVFRNSNLLTFDDIELIFPEQNLKYCN